MPFQSWQQNIDELPIDQIVAKYDSGFAGAVHDPKAEQTLDQDIAAAGGEIYGSLAGASFAGSAAGKLVVPFVFALQVFPDCLPASAQQRGDCVSHDLRNATLITLACEIVAGKPDEVTGLVEGIPDVTPEGIRDGVISTEYFYWWRGYNGDGWSCAAAVNVAIKRGMLLRKKYPELDIDLTKYSGKQAGAYGRSEPGDKILSEGTKHFVRTATRINSFAEVRDFLANGYGISTCGGEGFSSTRDENGVSNKKGGWAHAMAIIGADDRDEIKVIYKEPLVLVQNSWGPGWNSGPRKIRGTDLEIPKGSFWTKYSNVSRRSMFALSSINGFPAKQLPDLGFDPNILG